MFFFKYFNFEKSDLNQIEDDLCEFEDNCDVNVFDIYADELSQGRFVLDDKGLPAIEWRNDLDLGMIFYEAYNNGPETIVYDDGQISSIRLCNTIGL